MNTKSGKKGMGIVLAAIMVASVFAMAMPAMVSAVPQGASTNYLGEYNLPPNSFTKGHNISTSMHAWIYTTTTTTGILKVNITYYPDSASSVTKTNINLTDTAGNYKNLSALIGSKVIGIQNIQNDTANSTATAGAFNVMAREAPTISTSGSDEAQGGYITDLNLSVATQTGKWQGYFGNISGTIALAGSTGSKLYEWQWNATNGGEVLACNDTSVPDFSSLAAASTAEADTVTGFGTDSDNVTMTFNDGTAAVTVAGIAITNAPKAIMYDSNFNEVLLKDTVSPGWSDLIFCAIINNDATNFQGGKSDFELLVPDPETTSQTTTYYFYVELT